MSILRLWVIGAGVVAVVLIALGWFLGVSPRLAEAAASDADRVAVEAVNAGYEQTLVELRELSANLPAIQADLDDIRVEIPDEPDLASYLGQLNDLAQAAGVSLNEFTAETPFFVTGEAVDALGITDLVAVPVRVSALGPTEGLSAFLSEVQFGPRLVLVTAFTMGDDEETGRVSFDGFIFVLPEEGAALPSVDEGAVEGADPGATPTPTPAP